MKLQQLSACAVAVMLVAIELAAAPPASAQAGSCWQDTCTGLQPVEPQSNCSQDGYAVSGVYRTSPYGTVRLMYSPSCHSNWAEADGVTGDPHLVIYNSLGEEYWTGTIGGTWGYSAMVDGADNVPAGVCITSTSESLEWCVGQPGA